VDEVGLWEVKEVGGTWWGRGMVRMCEVRRVKQDRIGEDGDEHGGRPRVALRMTVRRSENGFR
jgi:hypothetical protein